MRKLRQNINKQLITLLTEKYLKKKIFNCRRVRDEIFGALAIVSFDRKESSSGLSTGRFL